MELELEPLSLLIDLQTNGKEDTHYLRINGLACVLAEPHKFFLKFFHMNLRMSLLAFILLDLLDGVNSRTYRVVRLQQWRHSLDCQVVNLRVR